MRYQFEKFTETPLLSNHLNLGGADDKGNRIDVTSRYLVRNQKPWIGVMGEFHFSRYARELWYEELCKMKAGGITIVSTYMFWIYHEETEGQFDFTGDLDIRAFVKECERAGLDVVLRIGPWAHGECRNGGFPDWLLQKKYALRKDIPEYLDKAAIWFTKIYEQVQGLFYKDGGNIIAIQLENELVNNAEHLLTLKKLAQKIGFQVPIYTVTGWNSAYGAKIPADDVLPVFGAYPEAPWTGHTKPLPPSPQYVFNPMRNDSAVGTDLIEPTDKDGWRLPYERYPFATCELGGGIEVTHHRRPIISGMDIYALSLVKLGSGNNLVGYYMYHGGTNKIGRLSTFNESKSTGYPNDYPILSYDFQGPLSQYGEVREQYRLLNILHMFVNDFGDMLAGMEYTASREKVKPEDNESLRYCMRTDGESGFVFINHYQRLHKLQDVFDVEIDTGKVVFPKINVCGNISFFLPFQMRLAENCVLEYATTQPLCRVGNTIFFTEVEGIRPEYRFTTGEVFRPIPGLDSGFKMAGVNVVTLTWREALYSRKLSETLFIGRDSDLYEADDKICAAGKKSFSYYRWDGKTFEMEYVQNPCFHANLTIEDIEGEPFAPTYAEEMSIDGERKRFWKKLTVDGAFGFVDITYRGDAAQIYADGVMVADDYYYGKPWRIPAKLLYKKECFLVYSEMKDDFYREFC